MITTTATSTSSASASSGSTSSSKSMSTGTARTPGIPRTTSRMATPPRSTRLDLHDAETVMGWIDGMAIGFRGFGSEEEAAHAAWAAYRTMSRRFARESGHRPLPIDTEPLSLTRDGDVEMILAAARPIATLVRPGADSPSGPDSFGFEIQAPVPTDDLTMRSTAYLVYRTLRRSGIRWTLFAPEPRAEPVDTSASTSASTPPASGEARPDDGAPDTATVAGILSRHGASRVEAARLRDDSTGILGTLLIALVALVVVILPAITASTVLPLLGTAAGLIALAALASLVHLVATDVRDSLRERPKRESRSDGAEYPAMTRRAA